MRLAVLILSGALCLLPSFAQGEKSSSGVAPRTEDVSPDACFKGYWTGGAFPTLALIPGELRKTYFDVSTRFEDQYLAKVLRNDPRYQNSLNRGDAAEAYAIEMLARKAFHTVDANHDCWLSNDELDAMTHINWGPQRVEGPPLEVALEEFKVSVALPAALAKPDHGVADKCFSGTWSGEVYSAPADIPDGFRSILEYRTTVHELDLISKALRVVHDDENPSKNWIDQLDVNIARNDLITARNLFREQVFAVYDSDNDERVTRAEVRRVFSKAEKDPDAVEKRTNAAFQLYDRNGDSIITKAEMRFIPGVDDTAERVALEHSSGFSHETLPIESRLKLLMQFISLAPEGGKLTSDDIEILARKVFHTIDTDGNCMISESEYVAAKDPAYVRAHTHSAKEIKTLEDQAAQGNADAQFRLGLLFFGGEGVEKSPAKTEDLWRAAASQGDTTAEYFLGMFYYEGSGGAPNYSEAAKWHRLAAEHGNLMSAGLLAQLYSSGKGVKKDEGKAVAWERFAAERGDGLQQFSLGRRYATGEGVPQDWREAYLWFLLSSRRLDDSPIRVGNGPRDEAENHLSAKEKAEVLLRAGQWKPSLPPAPEP